MSDLATRWQRLESVFRERFAREPEIGARAPGRVDLMGSHTDYNEGYVMTLPIDRDTWILAAARDDGQVNVHSLNDPECCSFGIADTAAGQDQAAPIQGWGKYVQAVAITLGRCGYRFPGFDAVVHGTVPIGSGLSSSASLEAAVATILEQAGGFHLTPLEKAKLCQRAENEWVGVNCGILDQYSSILGRAGMALLLDCRSLTHESAKLPDDIRPVICNTCAPRQLTGSEYGQRRDQCESGAEFFSQIDSSIRTLRDVPFEMFAKHVERLPEKVRMRCQFIIEENARVSELAKALNENDRPGIARLTSDSYFGARDLFEISVPAMQMMFDAMVNAPGCVGCRQAGAGFGGCMIALVETDSLQEFEGFVTSKYLGDSGIHPEIHIVSTADGAGRLDRSSFS